MIKRAEAAAFLFLALLFFIWPIPHTISIRDISFALAFILAAYIAARRGVRLRDAGFPAAAALAFAAWAVLVAFFVSGETWWSLKEIWSHWMKPLLALVLGVLIARGSAGGGLLAAGRLYALVFVILAFHVLYVDFYALWQYALTGVLPTRVAGLTEGMDKSSYLTAHLLMLLGAEALSRLTKGARGIDLPAWALWAVGAAAAFSVHLEYVRNGLMVLSAMALVFAALLFRSRSFTRAQATAGALVILAAALWTGHNLKNDYRWWSFVETVPLALDTDTNRAWLNLDKYPYPKLRDGSTVVGSNYERIAWIKEGLVLIGENPLGTGFGRNAFGHALKRKYNESFSSHSHSGIIDLGVGTGVPGLAIWAAFAMGLMYLGLRAFRRQGSFWGLALFLLTAEFSLRMAVDSNARDHMLQQFMFMAGLLYALTAGEGAQDKLQGGPSCGSSS